MTVSSFWKNTFGLKKYSAFECDEMRNRSMTFVNYELFVIFSEIPQVAQFKNKKWVKCMKLFWKQNVITEGVLFHILN